MTKNVKRTESLVQRSSVRIHFADGNKGGVGKSMFCRTLYQWFLDKDVPVIGFETDLDSPDFKDFYKDVCVSQFLGRENMYEQSNAIYKAAVEEKKSVVVNLPPVVHDAFKLWFNQGDVAQVTADSQIDLVKWFVCTGEFESMQSLTSSLKEFGAVLPHVVVRNQKYPEWEYFQDDAEIQGLIQEYGCKVIDLPKLPLQVANIMLQNRLSFSELQSYQSDRFGFVEQSAVKGYLRSAYAAFQDTGYLLK